MDRSTASKRARGGLWHLWFSVIAAGAIIAAAVAGVTSHFVSSGDDHRVHSSFQTQDDHSFAGLKWGGKPGRR
ncbi:MAG: hypothetical protein HYS09_02565 [Chloroflexi bacterium]|nr:hypothetical protein [Chloroflexota bacterium]